MDAPQPCQASALASVVCFAAGLSPEYVTFAAGGMRPGASYNLLRPEALEAMWWVLPAGSLAVFHSSSSACCLPPLTYHLQPYEHHKLSL